MSLNLHFFTIFNSATEFQNEKHLNFYFVIVDNTGNVKIWPSEEYLANHLIKNAAKFEYKSICELGAGRSGLAAIALAIKLKSKMGQILISDGNDEC